MKKIGVTVMRRLDAGAVFAWALRIGWQGHALTRWQLHPDRIATTDLQGIVLVCLHHALADFHRAVHIFTEKHGCTDLTFNNVFSLCGLLPVQDNAFGAHHHNNIGSLAQSSEQSTTNLPRVGANRACSVGVSLTHLTV